MKSNELFYFITVFYLEENSNTYKRTRCWGFFKSEEEAEEVVKSNLTDIYENGYYNTAVIEPVRVGICGHQRKTRWFTAQYDGNSGDRFFVEEIPTPERFKNILGFCFA